MEEQKDYTNPLEKRESIVTPEFLKEDKWFEVQVDGCFLDFAEPYRPPRFTLRRGDAAFANVGDLHIISGKPGNGKTGLMSMLITSILSGKCGNTEYALSAERPQPVVLYIDTEQSKDDTIAFKNRVCTMSGMNYSQPTRAFQILRLRDVESEVDRWRYILKAIYQVRPTDIFLDGMLDLVKDYNDQVECQPVIRKCMMLATEYDASLWMVLHENPLVSKLVGTLGSIAQRKVSEIFNVIKVKQCDQKPNEQDPSLPPIYFVVDQVKARGKDIGKWLYEFTNEGGWGMPIEIEREQKESGDTGSTGKFIPIEQVEQFMREIESNIEWPATNAQIEDALASVSGITNHPTRYEIITRARNRNWLKLDHKEGKLGFWNIELDPF